MPQDATESGEQSTADHAKEHQLVMDGTDTLIEEQRSFAEAPRSLPLQDTAWGHQLNQVWRQDNVAIYGRSRKDNPPHEFEVIIVRLEAEGIFPNGTVKPARYAYPSTSTWGRLAWSIPTLPSAIKWAHIVLDKLKEPIKGRTPWPELFTRFKE
jgi:hypothetical protein